MFELYNKIYLIYNRSSNERTLGQKRADVKHLSFTVNVYL